MNARTLLTGLSFSILWASASTATKIGLAHGQPFVIAVTRFLVAGMVMLAVSHLLLRRSLPAWSDWPKIMVYGLLNITIYLGVFIIALQYVSAGIGSLFIATNPVFISLISAVALKKPVTARSLASLVVCLSGILVAAYPLLKASYVTPLGLLLLLVSMLSYSLSALYFAGRSWNNIDRLTLNGWQTLIGGLLLVPLLLFTYEGSSNTWNAPLVLSVLWLAFPVSVGAIQLWLLLLKDDPVRASFWLFLCPIFGFVIAALLVQEPISAYTLWGVVLVLAGLYGVQKKNEIRLMPKNISVAK